MRPGRHGDAFHSEIYPKDRCLPTGDFRDPARTLEEYVDEMRRVARQAMRIGQIQNDNLVTPRDFVSVNDTRVMVMEWVDGLDVRQLLEPQRLERLRRTLPASEWERLNDVVVTSGSDHCRLKPGIAVDVAHLFPVQPHPEIQQLLPDRASAVVELRPGQGRAIEHVDDRADRLRGLIDRRYRGARHPAQPLQVRAECRHLAWCGAR